MTSSPVAGRGREAEHAAGVGLPPAIERAGGQRHPPVKEVLKHRRVGVDLVGELVEVGDAARCPRRRDRRGRRAARRSSPAPEPPRGGPGTPPRGARLLCGPSLLEQARRGAVALRGAGGGRAPSPSADRSERRGWDSNPRTERTRSTAFKAAAFNRSATPPGCARSVTRSSNGRRRSITLESLDGDARVAQLGRRPALRAGRDRARRRPASELAEIVAAAAARAVGCAPRARATRSPTSRSPTGSWSASTGSTGCSPVDREAGLVKVEAGIVLGELSRGSTSSGWRSRISATSTARPSPARSPPARTAPAPRFRASRLRSRQSISSSPTAARSRSPPPTHRATSRSRGSGSGRWGSSTR